MRDAPDAAATQVLTFVVGGEEFGIGIHQAREIIEYGELTTVPTAPAFIRGVINLRGSVVPVVDLAVRFGRAPSELTRKTCIVVVEVHRAGESAIMGVLADRVSQVAELPADAIEPPPEFGTGVRSDWLLGLGRTGSRFLLLLDIDRALAADAALASPPDDAQRPPA